MDCPKCKSSTYCKAGIVRGLQRFKCRECGFHYTVTKKSDVKSAETKRLALEMYLEGIGFRSIGRILKINYGTVYQWVKKWGEQADLLQNPDKPAIVELDEMHSYVGSKKRQMDMDCC